MAEYRLITVWRIDAPVQRVYEAVCRTARWPSWWWGVKNVVELEPGDELGVGSLQRYTYLIMRAGGKGLAHLLNARLISLAACRTWRSDRLLKEFVGPEPDKLLAQE